MSDCRRRGMQLMPLQLIQRGSALAHDSAH